MPPLIFRFWEIVSSNWKLSKIRWGRREKKGREAGMRQVWYHVVKLIIIFCISNKSLKRNSQYSKIVHSSLFHQLNVKCDLTVCNRVLWLYWDWLKFSVWMWSDCSLNIMMGDSFVMSCFQILETLSPNWSLWWTCRR